VRNFLNSFWVSTSFPVKVSPEKMTGGGGGAAATAEKFRTGFLIYLEFVMKFSWLLLF
jgi:hypothetical protein